MPHFNPDRLILKNVGFNRCVRLSKKDDLEIVFLDLIHLSKQYTSLSFELSFFSTIVTKPVKMTSITQIKETSHSIKTSGGTSFDVIFESYQKDFTLQRKPEMMIIYTDGKCRINQPNLIPKVPIFWVLTDKISHELPGTKNIYLKEMTTIFKELTQKIMAVKERKKPLTLYELGLQVDIENVEFLALMIYSMFNEWDMYEDVGFETKNQPVDLLHAIDILKPFYEDQAMILMMKGKDALNHYRLWEKKHKDLVLDCPHFEKKLTDDEVLLCIKDYDDSQSDFQLLSEGNVIISLLSIKTFLIYVKSIEFETKEIEYAIYSYLEMMNKFNVNLRSILLGCILYGIKEKI